MLYLIPGFQHSCSDEQYVRLIQAVEMAGALVCPVSINWKRTTIKDWIEEAERQLNNVQAEDSLVGFSFGAMVALQLARRKRIKALLLCSLSPYYSEYLATLPISWKRNLGVRRWEAFEQYALSESADMQSARVYLFVGDKEAQLFPSLKTTAANLQKILPESGLAMVHGAGHEIGNPEYIAAIVGALSALK